MPNIIVGLIVFAIVAYAVYYIVKQKKKGAKCIGCPGGSECTCNCNCQKEQQKK